MNPSLDISMVIADIIGGQQPHVVKLATEKLGVSRTTVYRHLQDMLDKGIIRDITETGKKQKKYEVVQHHLEWVFDLSITEPDEHAIWLQTVKPVLPEVDRNILDIISYGFQEMVNNVFSHSNGTKLVVALDYHAFNISISILDDGIGIFKKIQTDFDLADIREAVFELTKGKLTSDPKRHSGEGIFFTSRMMDFYMILSGKLSLVATNVPGQDQKFDCLMEPGISTDGTQIIMKIRRDAKTTMKDIFNAYAGTELDYAFKQTVIPVKLLQFEGESLLSRSQARRLISRFQKFSTVILDFDGVAIVGQAFADEVFRVFKNDYPNTVLITKNVNIDVEKMIKHVTRQEQ